MKPKFKRGTFKPHMGLYSREEAMPLPCLEYEGLAVHPYAEHPTGPKTHVSQITTGILAGNYATHAEARRAAIRMAPLCDWTGDVAALLANDDILFRKLALLSRDPDADIDQVK